MTSFGQDGVQRLSTIMHFYPNPSDNGAFFLSRNPAGQISSQLFSDFYAWTGHYAVNRNYTTNGLNQYSAAGPTGMTYDLNGNLIGSGSTTYSYDIENRLVGSGNVALSYDPLGRLFQISVGGAVTRTFLYDGDALVAEYNGSGTLTRRYAHWVGADVPMVSYADAALTSPTHLFADHQGSIVAHADGSGAVTQINRYDEYGIPAATNSGTFQYTGQLWLSEIGMYHYKARIYSPYLGRFLQTDPVGYYDQFNLYEYVGNDPVNISDPTGQESSRITTGSHIPRPVIVPHLPLPIAPPPPIPPPSAESVRGLQDALIFGIECVIGICGHTMMMDALQDRASQISLEEAASRPSDNEPIREGAEPVRPGGRGQDAIYHKPGGLGAANGDFDANADPDTVVDRGGGIRPGRTPQGNNITVRPNSGQDRRGPPTVDITRGSGRHRQTDKFRYRR